MYCLDPQTLQGKNGCIRDLRRLRGAVFIARRSKLAIEQCVEMSHSDINCEGSDSGIVVP